MKFLKWAMIAIFLSAPALAEDKEVAAPELRELVNCFPAKGITDFVSKFQKIDADKRDTVDMLFEAKFDIKDGGPLPRRIFIRDQGSETDFTLNQDGGVPDFVNIGMAPKTAELCSEDPSRVGTPKGGDDVSFGISSDVHFLANSGYHEVSTLQDGLKDGKTHYKKMVPGPMRMLVPTLKYVMIEYDVEETTPQYSAMKGQVPIEGLEHTSFCEMAMIKVKDLEDLGADGLQIQGGAYKLTPVPGPKTLAKFTECSKDNETESDK